MEHETFLSACVVTYNSGESAKALLNDLREKTRLPLRLYCVDNGSLPAYQQQLRNIPGTEFYENGKNLGFARAHNTVLDQKIGKYHFVINPDVEINTDVLSDIADFMEKNKDIAMLTPKIRNRDGTEQLLPQKRPTFKRMFFGRIFPAIRREYTNAERSAATVFDVDFCSGCFFCIRGDVFQQLHGFDERFFLYLEDADLTLRAQRFGRTVTAPQFEVIHTWQRASAKQLKPLLIHLSSAVKFLKKWRRSNP